MKLEFRPEPPAPATPTNRAAFFDAVRARTGEWAQWPYKPRNGNAARVTASNIKAGRYVSTYPGEFDAVTRQGQIWVRHVGDTP